MDDTFFELPPVEPADRPLAVAGAPRIQRPDRDQLELRSVDLEGLLPADHRARLVWEFVTGLDLAPLYARIRSTEGAPGRPSIDPAILTCLWLYATLEAVGSARALERLCDEHDAYRWICGGVSVNYHTLADFRVGHGELFDRLLTNGVAALMAEGLVSLARVAQDGVRVRASAGGSSFRGRDALTRALEDAETQVRTLRAELDDDPAATSRRVAAARERAARERAERARAALARLPAIEARRRRSTYKARREVPANVSGTDPEATFMKMPDRGFRPAYNAQLATDTASQVIVGLDLVTEIDQNQLAPMIEQLLARYGEAPAEHLVDGGYVNRVQISAVAAAGCGTTVYMPVPPAHVGSSRDPFVPHKRDSPAVIAWRARMATGEARRIYRERAATAECVNAIARNRGLRAFGVRGRLKARAVLLWFALAHNLMRAVTLRAAAAAT
jgi:transposase